jgi:DNA polymerase-1
MRVKIPDGYRPVDGPFCRLAGYAVNDGPVILTTDMGELIAALDAADVIQGHNIISFDLLALAWHHGADFAALAAKAWDTDPASRQHTPPRSREHGSEDKYDLDHVARRLGVEGKITGDTGLGSLKRKHGGYDRIPIEDPDFRAYLVQDVIAAREVAGLLFRTPYIDREHRLATLAGHMTLNGFRIDEPLLRQRIREGQERKAAARKELNERYNIPLGRTVERGRKPNKTEHFVPYKAPLATRDGKDALIRAFADLGAKYFPQVDKTVITHPVTGVDVKDIATGRDAMQLMSDYYDGQYHLGGVARLCELVTVVTTVRTIYQTDANNLAPDGRVHPSVSMRQASGRWSVGSGFTVHGKRDGKHIERDVFVADPGHVVITCDLSQVDMRAVAAHSQDRNYMKLFEPGRDAHQEVADMLGISRHEAKARGHGWNYGLGAKRMIREGAKPDVVWTFVNGMANNFPRLCEWRDEVRERASDGELLDNGFGRKMRCDPSWAYTVGPALMGQGTARDITCESLLMLVDKHPDYVKYLRGHAHDEFIFSVPADQAEIIGKNIKDSFEWVWRGVPILADLSPVGSSWGECSAKG